MREYTILLDSSSTDLAVGIALGNDLLKETIYPAWQKQSEYMVSELDNLMNDLSITKDDIKDVVLAIGPASYTGVRIALTIAKTIYLCTNCDVYSVSSLQILKCENKKSICLINARSDRSYFGVYENYLVIENDQILTNEEVKEYINSHPDYVVCGDTKYLDIESYKSDVLKEMLFLKDTLKKEENPDLLSPVYLKSYE
ncbi:MAG: tRNA (adenosine(37)-N6)-threonylcarbamoyltransferase complex dimerization subunit type 1 TsaB [Coprobacillus sp.]|nr:tRNA (adenosine(37)-N6)-threonylcarbamoyltransferase complex dimerization subunit type 1 TsaB [Coprobacillus sp.]